MPKDTVSTVSPCDLQDHSRGDLPPATGIRLLAPWPGSRTCWPAGGPSSYEFFPPKSEAAAKALDDALEDLTALGPSFVSVTYGALGSTRAPTRDLVIRIDGERPFPAMPHLTCVGQTRDDLLVLLEQYRDAGIENVLALAGDPPPDGSDPGGDFTYATELIELARSVRRLLRSASPLSRAPPSLP